MFRWIISVETEFQMKIVKLMPLYKSISESECLLKSIFLFGGKLFHLEYWREATNAPKV